jgi:hypothetical protein
MESGDAVRTALQDKSLAQSYIFQVLLEIVDLE